MKKSILLFAVLLFLSCDDGEIVVEDLSFSNIDVKACLPGATAGNRTYLFYKSDASNFESLSVQLATSTSFFDVDGIYEPFELNMTNKVEYRKYDNAPGDDYFCSLLPPASPKVIDALVSTSGQVNLTVTNQVLTSAAALANEESPSLDSDGDGIPNYLEPSGVDTDGDGLPNKIDADDDGDNVLTIDEGVIIENGVIAAASQDLDEDGIPNYLDNDDDGDGTFTIYEDLNRDSDPTNDSTNGSQPNYLNKDISTPATPAIDAFREHQYIRIPVVEIKIPNVTLVRNGETVVFDDADSITNYGTYIRAAYQLMTTPNFIAPE